jgi:hypothetical protein
MKRVVCVFSVVLMSCCVALPSRPQEITAPAVGLPLLQVSGHLEQPPEKDNGCPSGMQRVTGDFCPRVEQTCLRWLDKDQSPTANSGIGPLRCAEFAPPKCLSDKRVRKDFCMDSYEWPDRKDALPPVSMTWFKAKSNCESVGKRLCTDSEWTFACEGEEMRPYPYGDGLHRDESVCDQTHDPMPDPSLPQSEWPKYYPGHASGSFPLCKSTFEVFDLVSGVDEWVVNESGHPYISGLKGGYGTNRVRTRCRPMTTVHGPDFSFYQIGTRCCKNTK